jgi:hypothetical protein
MGLAGGLSSLGACVGRHLAVGINQLFKPR